MDYVMLKKECRKGIQEKLDYERDWSDSEIQEAIDRYLTEEESMRQVPLSVKRRLRKELFDSMRRLDLLEFFLENQDISEIMINGSDSIFIEKDGILEKLNMAFESEELLREVIQKIVSKCNRTVNDFSPIVDARLEDARVNVVMPPVSLGGPVVTIRRFPKEPITLKKLVAMDSVSEECAAFLNRLVIGRYNIFISGSTGSGKTTFLNALSECIPNGERIVTIEDNAELKLLGIENLVRLETRNRNVEGIGEITIRDLIKTSLRMRPSRIVIGEVRGEEALDMLQAMNTGHDGSMSTGHANSAKDMVKRLQNMVLMGASLPLDAIRSQIMSGINIMIHLGRLRDGSRRVMEIVELGEFEENDGFHILYRFYETGERDGKILGELRKEGELYNDEKLLAAGLAR